MLSTPPQVVTENIKMGFLYEPFFSPPLYSSPFRKGVLFRKFRVGIIGSPHMDRDRIFTIF